MAFSLFKKKNYADIIFEGGTFYTLDPEYPRASALAVKSGRVMLAGEPEEMKSMDGPDTQHVNINGGFAVPGFIEAFGTPVRKTLQGTYLKLEDSMDAERVVSAVKWYFSQHPEAEFCLGIDLSEKLCLAAEEEQNQEETEAAEEEEKAGTETAAAAGPEESSAEGPEEENPAEDPAEGKTDLREMLDRVSPDRPVILACCNGFSMIINSAARELVKARAEEMGVHTVTPAFVMDTIVSSDFNVTLKQMFCGAEDYARQGITSVYSGEKYGFLENIYRDNLIEAFQADMMKQRYFGSQHVRRAVPASSVLFMADRRRTICQELGGMINYTTVEIRFSAEESSEDHMSAAYVRNLAESAADKGYHVRFLALDKQAALESFEIAGNLSSSYHKLSFTVIHKEDITDEELSSVYTGEVSEIAVGGCRKPEAKTGEALVRLKTEETAARLGILSSLGTLEEGKWADMAVFAEDPMQTAAENAVMTVLAGKPVWQKDADSAAAWTEALTGVIDSNTAELFGPEDAAEETQEVL